MILAAAFALYGVAALTFFYLNPQSRLHPFRALATLTLSDGQGDWHFPWQHLRTIAVFGVTVFVAEALGRLAGVQDIRLRLMAGYGVLGLLMFALGIAGLYGFRTIWGTAVLIVVVRWLFRRARFPNTATFGTFPAPAQNPRRILSWLVLSSSLIALFPALLYALTPPIQSDGLRYHLAALQEYLKAGRIVYLPFNAFTNLPFLVEMVYLMPLGLGSDSAVHLVHLSFLFLSAEMIYRCLAEHSEGGGPCISHSLTIHVVRLLFWSSPVTLIVSAWPFIDAAVTAFFLAMLLSLLRWRSDPKSTGHLLLCGFFGGACLASKYTMFVFTGLTVLTVLALFLLRPSGNFHQLKWKAFGAYLMVLIVAAAPWYVKNAVFTGNPVYPLAGKFFPGGEWGERSARLYAAKAGAKGLKRLDGFVFGPVYSAVSWTPNPYARLPLARLNYEDQNPGLLVVLFLPLILAGVARVVKNMRRGVFCWHSPPVLISGFAVVYYCFWFFTYQSNRFLLPFFALWVYGVVWTTNFLMQTCWKRVRAVAIILMLSTILYGFAWSTEWMLARTRVPPLSYLSGYQSRWDYIRRALPWTEAFDELDRLAGAGERTLFIGEYRGYYCRAAYVANDFFDQPVILAYLRRSELDLSSLRAQMLADDIHFIFLNWAELKKYMDDFQSFFTPEEWSAFEQFLNVPWLQVVWHKNEDFFIYRIK